MLLGDEAELVSELASPPKVIESHNFVLPESGIEWDTFERDCLAQAMQRFDGNRTKAAKLLGMSYKAFLYRLEKHQLV